MNARYRPLLPALLAALILLPLRVHAYSHNFGELSSIHAAVMRNDVAFVTQWIREKRNVDEEYNDTEFCIHGCYSQMRKVTPLMVAADRGNLPIVKMLVEAGADVNRESTYPPSSIPDMGPLPPIAVFDYAVDSGKIEVVEYLAKDPHLARPPPHLAQDFRQAFADACSPWNLQKGQRAIAEFLLTTYGPQEATGALRAVSHTDKCLVLAQLLLDAGVKPDAAAMSIAARFGLTDLVRLYLSKGGPVNEVVKGPELIRLPLSEAAREPHLETMRVLLDAGADPNLVDRAGWTPLNWSAARGALKDCPDSVAAMKMLIDHGARTGVDSAIRTIDSLPASECTAAKRALLTSGRL